MPHNPGDIINNRYRIIRQLGQGGFANVYRAEDLRSRRICALKENLDYWDESQRQFEREANLLANLRHPNLPAVSDYFTLLGEGQYLVMEYIGGYDFQEILNRVNQPLIEKKVLSWIDQVCDALNFLHSQSPPVIHRDIKPANLKLTPADKVVLVDFGVAKTYDPGQRTTMAARAVTPGYSPIEQYGHGATDARTDQYALAATLYTLLTNQRPPESIERVTGTRLAPPSEINPQISPQVDQAILRGMELLAANRYDNISEFRRALKRLSGQLGARRITGSLSPGGGKISTGPLPPMPEEAARLEWIAIPEGEFLFGEERRPVYLAAFEIARFPVTNHQYSQFLIASPYLPAPAHWKGRDYPRGRGQHPVTGVNLNDALAFCEWLECRLPSEEQWEKAARGTDGRLYPWGEDWLDGLYCNNWDAKIGGTTPVDRYPQGVSPFGVWDMSGNVWEWTKSEYQGPFMHVVRGGSWREFGNFAVRATVRSWLWLEEGRDDIGFRPARGG